MHGYSTGQFYVIGTYVAMHHPEQCHTKRTDAQLHFPVWCTSAVADPAPLYDSTSTGAALSVMSTSVAGVGSLDLLHDVCLAHASVFTTSLKQTCLALLCALFQLMYSALRELCVCRESRLSPGQPKHLP